MVAHTQKNTTRAAKLAVIDHEMENLELLILSVEEAVKQSSLFKIFPHWYPKQVGDITKGMDDADHKILSVEIKLGSQY